MNQLNLQTQSQIQFWTPHQTQNIHPLDITKSITTYSDIAKLFKSLRLNDGFSLIDKQYRDNDNVVFLGNFYLSNGNLHASIQVFDADYRNAETLYYLQRNGHSNVNVSSDWTYSSKLWFKYNKQLNDYDSFNSYIDEYRENFTVNLNKPLVVFNVKL